jgi:hypothetical protein
MMQRAFVCFVSIRKLCMICTSAKVIFSAINDYWYLTSPAFLAQLLTRYLFLGVMVH